MRPMMPKHTHIILFDGICNLCNSSVLFIIKRDPKALFSFATLQNKTAQDLLDKHQLNHRDMDSLVYIKEGRPYHQSTAALHICKQLKGLWPLLYGFILIPKGLRDPIYRWIARNRYIWFGKKEECMLPDEQMKSRFINGLD